MKRIQFKISSSNVELFETKPNQKLSADFLDNLRNRFSQLTIQAISSKYVLGKSHAKKIISVSKMAEKNNTLLSKKLETDILLRFAGTTQILDALKLVGIEPSSSFIVFAIGNKKSLDKLYRDLKPILNPKPLSKNNQGFLKKKFNITKKQLDSIVSESPIEDLLLEKAATLF